MSYSKNVLTTLLSMASAGQEPAAAAPTPEKPRSPRALALEAQRRAAEDRASANAENVQWIKDNVGPVKEKLAVKTIRDLTAALGYEIYAERSTPSRMESCIGKILSSNERGLIPSRHQNGVRNPAPPDVIRDVRERMERVLNPAMEPRPALPGPRTEQMIHVRESVLWIKANFGVVQRLLNKRNRRVTLIALGIRPDDLGRQATSAEASLSRIMISNDQGLYEYAGRQRAPASAEFVLEMRARLERVISDAYAPAPPPADNGNIPWPTPKVKTPRRLLDQPRSPA